MPDAPVIPTAPLAGLGRRLACMVYELMLLLAVLFVSGFVVVGLLPDTPTLVSRGLTQFYLMLVAGLYLTWFWRRGGQTLAMKTWRVRLVRADGGLIDARTAWQRYLFAVIGLVLFGFGFWWALWDRDRQFLHDRLAGTRLVRDA